MVCAVATTFGGRVDMISSDHDKFGAIWPISGKVAASSNYKGRNICLYVCVTVLRISWQPFIWLTSHLVGVLPRTQGSALSNLRSIRRAVFESAVSHTAVPDHADAKQSTSPECVLPLDNAASSNTWSQAVGPFRTVTPWMGAALVCSMIKRHNNKTVFWFLMPPFDISIQRSTDVSQLCFRVQISSFGGFSKQMWVWPMPQYVPEWVVTSEAFRTYG